MRVPCGQLSSSESRLRWLLASQILSQLTGLPMSQVGAVKACDDIVKSVWSGMEIEAILESISQSRCPDLLLTILAVGQQGKGEGFETSKTFELMVKRIKSEWFKDASWSMYQASLNRMFNAIQEHRRAESSFGSDQVQMSKALAFFDMLKKWKCDWCEFGEPYPLAWSLASHMQENHVAKNITQTRLVEERLNFGLCASEEFLDGSRQLAEPLAGSEAELSVYAEYLASYALALVKHYPARYSPGPVHSNGATPP